MKKMILLSLLMLGTLTTFAQIEEYVPQNMDNYQPTDEDWYYYYLYTSPYPILTKNTTSDASLDLRGLHLYSTVVLDKITNETLWTPSYNPQDNTIRVKKLQKGQTYEVVDILLQSKINPLISKLKSATIIGDDAIYEDRGKEKSYPFQMGNILPYLDFQDFSNPIYVLKGDDKCEYYIRRNVPKDYMTRWIYRLNKKGECVYPGYEHTCRVGYWTTLSSFICVETYDFIKKNYVGQEIVTANYNGGSWDSDSYVKERDTNDGQELYTDNNNVWSFDNVSFMDNKLYVTLHKSYTQMEVVDISSYQFGSYRSPIHDSLCTIGTYRDSYNGSIYMGFCLRKEADSIVQKNIKAQEEARKLKNLENKNRQQELTQKYGSKFAADIMKGEASVGMTAEMVKEAKGSPCKKNSSTDASGVYEIWTYNCFEVEYMSDSFVQFEYEYILLRNGKVFQITK